MTMLKTPTLTLPALSLPLLVALVAATAPSAAAAPKKQAPATSATAPAQTAPALPQTTGFAIPTLTEDGAPIPRSAGLPYAPKNLADRIVLTPGADPARAMAVAYRTNVAQKTAEVQLAISVDGPTLEEKAQTLTGITLLSQSSYGPALYHQVRFANLTPDTVYNYRVKGEAGWSEWYQFRTAAAAAKPFRFLYLGDIQNGILTYAARVVRQAFIANGDISLVAHAGDLVAQRDDLDHDDEWGEWNQVGGYNYASIPQLPATGNHEYADLILPNGQESRILGPYWHKQFALPKNGADAVKATTYFVDYQGVRFIVLDGTAAIELGSMKEQTAWLDQTLASSRAKWNVVLFHQPVFTCARPKDTGAIKAAWKPVFEARGVDLVLQGHDHCYSRLTAEAGRAASAQARTDGSVQGPVYLVSVTGAKMYGLNNRARTQTDRTAEATELYQIIDVDGENLRFRTYTASGKLYDGFNLQKDANGRNRLSEIADAKIAERFCTGTPDASGQYPTGPDGGTCVAEPKD
ncbi:purple acid phosphatase family protein [Sphingopyxis yananensis]|uniref:purple acid phosphatase family protein n=1 Tax=Sphingopyxis yananensis TaxID=2886687 RepID=UPI001D121C4C|nr:metallophosphoesterase family protein [Sphingopyxis yananensis]MCC2603399.1 metallophosphoesterase family protein [Sphingopyxis yananensis]